MTEVPDAGRRVGPPPGGWQIGPPVGAGDVALPSPMPAALGGRYPFQPDAYGRTAQVHTAPQGPVPQAVDRALVPTPVKGGRRARLRHPGGAVPGHSGKGPHRDHRSGRPVGVQRDERGAIPDHRELHRQRRAATEAGVP